MSKEIEYLTFEGGGGKGIVYLGAIKALEEKKLLPIPMPTINSNEKYNHVEILLNRKIKGISGASAGAITAFLLAMGLDSGQIGDIMMRKHKGINRFSTFFDNPSEFIAPFNDIKQYVGYQRSIEFSEGNQFKVGFHNEQFPKDKINYISNKILNILYRFIDLSFKIPNKGLANRLLKESKKDGFIERNYFIINLLYGKGIFNGFGIRDFFSEIMEEFLIEPNRPYLESKKNIFKFITTPKPAYILTFKHFFFLTGVDLRLTGVNLKDKKPYYFSAFHTPNFPVIEAVAISMNIPGLFRPILVKNGNRNGEWIDGGLLNNYPIHAFDNVEDEYPQGFKGDGFNSLDSVNLNSELDILPKEIKGFNQKVFGFNLAEKFPNDIPLELKEKWEHKGAAKEVEEINNSEYSFSEVFTRYILKQVIPPLPPSTINKLKKIHQLNLKKMEMEKQKQQEIQIIDLFQDLYNIVLYPSSEGQIRTIQEKISTIDLPTYNLSVTEFEPFANPSKIFLSIDSNKDDKYTTPVHFAYHTVLDKLKEFD